MGSYSTLYVGDQEICSKKHELDPMIMTLFLPSERSLKAGTIGEIAPFLLDDDGANATEDIELLRYETSLSNLRDRLNLMGFTLEFIHSQFKARRELELEEWLCQEEVYRSNQILDVWEAKKRAFEELSFDRWLKVFQTFWADKAKWVELYKHSDPPAEGPLDDLLMWFVSTQRYELPYSFFSDDARVVLRCLCQVLVPNSPVVYDLTELASEAGDAHEFAEFAESFLDGGYSTTRRIIVLTEGCTDQRAIEGSLKLLRPGIHSYFSFLDFEALAIQGSMSSVLNMLKAFISVGIANRIIAILDNDTAAHVAVQSARLGTLPENVRIVFLPRVPIAENYPTLGPTGMTAMDINGLACSVELYFGADVLSIDSGELMPIQWKGYEDKLKRYQGEIMHKGTLQSRFRDKLAIASKDAEAFKNQDWSAMEELIESVVSAFHDLPPLDYGLEGVGELD